MIDYLFQFTDEATARADATVGPFFVGGSWRGDVCIPNQSAVQISTGTPQTGFILTVSLSQDNPAWHAHPALRLAVDWNAPQLLFVATGYVPNDYAISPIFQGRDPSVLGLPN